MSTKSNNQLLKSTSTVSSMTFLSRIVGFIRDMVIAHIFGANAALDSFLLAFKIPNFLRRLFAEGAFSQAFIPVLSEYKECYSRDEAKDLINKVFGSLAFVLLLVSILGVLFAPYLVRLFAPGFSPENERFELATQILQLTFPYLFFISLTALAASIQNAYQKFAAPAFTPVLLNLSLIIAALFSSHLFAQQPIMALAWGVLVAGVVQLLFQIPFLYQLSLLPRFKWDWQDSGVRRVLTLMVPALIGASAMQINLLVDTIFASFLPVGSLTWLYYSDRLLEFPIGIFGVALATVVLPHLSKEFAKRSPTGFSASLDWALRWILLVGVPAMLGLIYIATPILTTLFQYGRFESHDVIMASKSLIALSLGLVFFLSIKILVSAFYARQNTKLPVKVALFAMLMNIIFNALLIGPLAHAGLALASSLASMCNVAVLLYFLLKRKIYIPMPGWAQFLIRLLVANTLMVVMLWWFTPEKAFWFEWHAPQRAFNLLCLIGGAGLAYFGGLWLCGLKLADLRLQSV